MVAARLLDVLLVLVLLVYLGEGWRNGFARSVSAIVGILVGGVLAFFAIPLIAAVIPVPFWRTVVVVAVAVGLLVGGHAGGAAVGNAIRGRIKRGSLSGADHFFGALINGISSVLVIGLITASISSLGVPVLSAAISQSVVLRALDNITPQPVEAAIARLRSAILEQGLPSIAEALGGVTTSPGVPDVNTGTGVLGVAAQSVVRISGTAYACGQNQSGSGFVVANNRIVTNAHVVAGVAEPVVEAPNGQSLDGSVVYFDPNNDIAVIAVSGLSEPPLPLAPNLAVGDKGVVDGYPFGGPFTTGPAQVLAVSDEQIQNIYNTGRSVREVYSLAATVNPGNSGGPLLTTSGEIAGIVFARSSSDADLGYAMTNTVLASVVLSSSGLSTPVEPGTCVKD